MSNILQMTVAVPRPVAATDGSAALGPGGSARTLEVVDWQLESLG